MITVLQLVHKYRGNYELFNLQAGLDRQRFRMVVCYLSGVPDGKDRMVDVADRVIYLQCRPDRMYWYNLPLLLKLKKIIDAELPQVVNCQQHRTTPLGVMARMLSKSRPVLISTLHGLGTARSWQRKLFNWVLYRHLYRIVGISTGVSRDIVASNWALSPEKVLTIQNGLDYGQFLTDFDQREAKGAILPGKQDYFWFGTAGRLSMVKNHETLIDAFALNARELPGSILVIAGQGDLEAALKCRALEHGLAERVFFLGFRQDMPQVLQAFDVFLLPSVREGFGLALVEAMASARPVIASRVGGIPEIIDDGAFARLVEPADTAEIARAMLEFAAMPEAERLRLGMEARQRAVTGFDAGRMVASYEQLYAEAASTWHGSTAG